MATRHVQPGGPGPQPNAPDPQKSVLAKRAQANGSQQRKDKEEK